MLWLMPVWRWRDVRVLWFSYCCVFSKGIHIPQQHSTKLEPSPHCKHEFVDGDPPRLRGIRVIGVRSSSQCMLCVASYAFCLFEQDYNQNMVPSWSRTGKDVVSDLAG